MSLLLRKPRPERGFHQGRQDSSIPALRPHVLAARKRWGLLLALGVTVMLPGIFATATLPNPVALSPMDPITLQAEILHAFPGSQVLVVEPTMQHKVSGYRVTLRTTRGAVWIAFIGLNGTPFTMARTYQPSQVPSQISLDVAKSRALSSVGGGHVVSFGTQGNAMVFNIMVQTGAVFIVTINRESGQVVSVKDA